MVTDFLYTPGPWHQSRTNIIASDGQCVAILVDVVNSNRLANGELISASPDLLKALMMVEWIPIVGPAEGFYCPWCKSDQDKGHDRECLRQVVIEKVMKND